MTIGERVRFVRTSFTGANGRHLSLDKFGERIGLKRSALSAMENGDQGVTDQTIMSICREFGVSPEWLRDGVGEPFPPKPRDQQIIDYVSAALQKPPDAIEHKILALLAKISEDEWEKIAAIAERIANENN